MTDQPRQPEGIPAGGQFACKTHAEPEVSLGQQAHGLTVAPGAEGRIADLLTASDLPGRLEPYTGDNPDFAADAVDYIAPSGRLLVLHGAASGELAVSYDEDLEHCFNLYLDADEATPDAFADRVREGLWTIAVDDAHAESPLSLTHGGDVYELRSTEIDRDPDGSVYGRVVLNDIDNDRWLELSYNFGTGEVALYDGEHRLTGLAEEAELDAVLVDFRREPEGTTDKEQVGRIFRSILTTAAADPDATDWARQTAGEAGE